MSAVIIATLSCGCNHMEYSDVIVGARVTCRVVPDHGRVTVREVASIQPATSPAVNVHVLFMETSDQYGTSQPAGVYSSVDAAQMARTMIRTSRSYVKAFTLDAPPVPPRGRTL